MENGYYIAIAAVLVAIAGFWIFRRRARLRIKGPGGASFDFSGSNEPSAPVPGVRMKDVTSQKGAIIAADQTGRGVEMDEVKAQKDILATSRPPKDHLDPKA